MTLFSVLNLVFATIYVVSKSSFLRLISWLYFLVAVSVTLLNGGHTWLVASVMFLSITSFILTEFFSISNETFILKKKEESSWNKSKTLLAVVSIILFSCLLVFSEQNKKSMDLGFSFNDSFAFKATFGYQEAVLIMVPLVLLVHKVRKLLESK